MILYTWATFKPLKGFAIAKKGDMVYNRYVMSKKRRRIEKMKKYLTSGEYCLGIRCPSLLWKSRNADGAPSLLSERTLIKLHHRSALEKYRELISDCVHINSDSCDDAKKETEAAIGRGALCISGATFISGDLCARCDVIKRRSDGTYALYVVKAAAHLHQTVCHDASFQVYVLAKNGIRVSRVFFVKLNTGYVQGESDPKELFLLENISARVASLVGGVEGRASNMLKLISQGEMPETPIHNGCFAPSDCENRDICFAHLPEDNIFTLSGISHQIKFKLYRSRRYNVGDVLREGGLTPRQKKQLEMFEQGLPPEIDRENIEKFLSQIKYPIAYLDFETMQLPFPPFEGLRPFEPCAFQFSLHVKEKPGKRLRHTSFIARPGTDPRRAIAEALVESIPKKGSVGAYNMQLERMMLLSLANRFEDLRESLVSISNRLFDMMKPFEKNWYYDGGMKGACSLKAVLHALYPDDSSLDYRRLQGVHNGQEATNVYAALSSAPGSFPEEKEILSELEKYCALDTLALDKLYEKLSEAVREKKPKKKAKKAV